MHFAKTRHDYSRKWLNLTNVIFFLLSTWGRFSSRIRQSIMLWLSSFINLKAEWKQKRLKCRTLKRLWFRSFLFSLQNDNEQVKLAKKSKITNIGSVNLCWKSLFSLVRLAIKKLIFRVNFDSFKNYSVWFRVAFSLKNYLESFRVESIHNMKHIILIAQFIQFVMENENVKTSQPRRIPVSVLVRLFCKFHMKFLIWTGSWCVFFCLFMYSLCHSHHQITNIHHSKYQILIYIGCSMFNDQHRCSCFSFKFIHFSPSAPTNNLLLHALNSNIKYCRRIQLYHKL